MATTLPADASATHKEAALTQFATAIGGLHGFSIPVLDITKTIFGEDAALRAVSDKKEEMKEIPANGSFGEGGALSALMRAARILRDDLNSPENAEEVVKLVKGHWVKEHVDEALVSTS